MKHVMTLAALTGGLLASATAHAGQQTVRLAVSNMYCAACPMTVKKALTAVPGVSKAEVSCRDKTAVVTFDDQKAAVQALIDAATNAGYPTKLAEARK